MNYSSAPFENEKTIPGKLFVWDTNKNRKITMLILGWDKRRFIEQIDLKVFVLKVGIAYGEWETSLGTRSKFSYFGDTTYVL